MEMHLFSYAEGYQYNMKKFGEFDKRVIDLPANKYPLQRALVYQAI